MTVERGLSFRVPRLIRAMTVGGGLRLPRLVPMAVQRGFRLWAMALCLSELPVHLEVPRIQWCITVLSQRHLKWRRMLKWYRIPSEVPAVLSKRRLLKLATPRDFPQRACPPRVHRIPHNSSVNLTFCRAPRPLLAHKHLMRKFTVMWKWKVSIPPPPRQPRNPRLVGPNSTTPGIRILVGRQIL